VWLGLGVNNVKYRASISSLKVFQPPSFSFYSLYSESHVPQNHIQNFLGVWEGGRRGCKTRVHTDFQSMGVIIYGSTPSAASLRDHP